MALTDNLLTTAKRRLRDLYHKLTTRQKVIIGIVACIGAGYAFCLPGTLFHAPYSTVVTDRNGTLLGARIAKDGQWRFPPLDSVPYKMRECLVCFEDKRFYRHWGVDVLALGRAMWQNVRNRRIVSGGSTLTMQVIRLARQRPRTLPEKAIEALWATRLEFRCSKQEILAMYASHAPFGGNVVGLDAAAWRYFGHSAEELSWAEAATLAVLPNAPSLIHPGKGRDTKKQKRNRLLHKLHEQGKLTASDYTSALHEPLPQAPQALPQQAPHLVNYLNQTRNGLHSATTLDQGLQQQIEALAERWSNEFSRSDIRNLAILVADLQTNEVLAYCGNTHFGTQEGSQVDIIRSPRSTGSILKPFLYYAMLDEGLLLPGTLLPDIPLNINGFSPQNFNQEYEGAIPAGQALARSLNVPSVVMLQRYSVPKLYDLLRRAGLKDLHYPPSHYGLSLILGGAEATLWDITTAYANMARSVIHLPQNALQLLLPTPTTPPNDGQPAATFHPGASWQTLEALTEVNRPEEIDWKSIPSMTPVAWKTGTSNGFRDAWAVGVTPHYAVGVWVGNATGEGKPGLIGARTAGPVLFETLNLLPPSAPAWFPRPEGVFVEAAVCPQSGHLLGRFCEEADTVLILPAGLKTEACPYHQPVILTADGKYRLYEQCTATGDSSIRRTWFTLPPVWEWYYRRQHPEYSPLPPLAPGCGEDALRPMQFIYPTYNARIALPLQMDGARGFMKAELAHNNPASIVYWHMDEEYMGQTQDFHQITLQPSTGRHTLTAVDSQGNTISTLFYVENK